MSMHMQPVMCRQHTWVRSTVPGMVICTKCQKTAKARQARPRREQLAQQPAYSQSSPHHAGFYSGIHPEDQPYQSDQFPLQDEDDAGDAADYDSPRTPNSVVRYLRPYVSQGTRDYDYAVQEEVIDVPGAAPAGRATTNGTTAGAAKRKGRHRHVHPLFLISFLILLLIALWQGVLAAATDIGYLHDNITYGYPRTSQTDAVVGHTDSEAHPSHFFAVNLHAHIYIIEFPAGNPRNAKIYDGGQLYGQNADRAPVTVTFTDVDRDGHVDMIIHVQGGQIIFLNKQAHGTWQFVPQQSQ